MTRTVVALPVSRAAYDEIAELLRTAGYDHVFVAPPLAATTLVTVREKAINMDGIALITEVPPAKAAGKKYRLVLTCAACPEQYDVYDEKGGQVGYLRLRHGRFSVEYPNIGGEIVYLAAPAGDGLFVANERQFHLTQAVMSIHRRITMPPPKDDGEGYDDETQKDEQWITVP